MYIIFVCRKDHKSWKNYIEYKEIIIITSVIMTDINVHLHVGFMKKRQEEKGSRTTVNNDNTHAQRKLRGLAVNCC